MASRCLLTAARRPAISALRPCLPITQARFVTPWERMQKSQESMARQIADRQPIGTSYRTGDNLAEAMNEGAELLLQGTFVAPPLSRRPSIFSDTRNRLKFERVRFKTALQDLVSRLLARVWHKDPFFRNDMIPAAEALHRNMYTSYALGDVDTISQICARDLSRTLRARIGSRQPNVRFAWQFLRHNSRSKLMSHKVGMLSSDNKIENSVRQAVVRIDSTQRLTKGVDGKVVKGTGEPVRTTEFVVLHKRRQQGKPETEWTIWGTIAESTMDDVHAHALPPASGDQIATGASARWD